MKEISQEEIIYNQISTVYDHNEIESLLNQQVNMFNICEKLNISQYKSVNGVYYTILKISRGLFNIMFDTDGTKADIKPIAFSSINNKEKVANINVGMTLKDVQTADPDGQYDFLYHNSANYPRISYHYFENGDAISIKYESDIITQIIHFTI
ncbi:MAG: hypothetical protein ACI4II_01070 [Acutalibacteraceae bacterium]